jgi:hypothetical protein
MKIARTACIVLTFVAALSCARSQGSQSESASGAVPNARNALLAELAQEDQDYRTGKQVQRSDQDRANLVLAELGKGTVRTAEDKTNAAVVLQHTGMTFCGDKLVSLSPDNYLLAHELAKSAHAEGYEPARYLVAQTIDRYLSLTEGYQKYGTNRLINQESEKEELPYIDRRTTDEERARYGVPPLAELLKRWPERKKP